MSCKTVDAKLSILFPDGMIENARNVVSTLLNTHVSQNMMRNIE